MQTKSEKKLVEVGRWVGVVSGILLSLSVYSQQIFYVKAGGVGNGSSWEDASGNLQEMINVAQAGDEIWVAEGVYTPGEEEDIDASFILKDGVALYGGFAGHEEERDERDWIQNLSILSGDLNGDDFDDDCCNRSDNARHVVRSIDTGPGTILDGFSITSGNAEESIDEEDNPATFMDGHGGGLLNVNGAPKIRNCIFYGNFASAGAGIFNVMGSPTIVDCLFSENDAILGAGIASAGGGATIEGCSFEFNTALRGGSIANVLSAPVIRNTSFVFNFTADGNVWNYLGSATIQQSDFFLNLGIMGVGVASQGSEVIIDSCAFLAQYGAVAAGLYSAYGTLKISNSVLGGNQSYLSDFLDDGEIGGINGFGGAICTIGSQSVINNCDIFSNGSDGVGGAIALGEQSESTIINCLFSENQAETEGAVIYNYKGELLLVNSTVADNWNYDENNSAVHTEAGSNTQILNSIFWENSEAHGITKSPGPEAVVNVSHSIVQGGYDGGNIISDDPMFKDPDYLDYRLKPCSPAINAGLTDYFIPGGIVDLSEFQYDLEGESRIHSVAVDIGAYENPGFKVATGGAIIQTVSCQKGEWTYFFDEDDQSLVLAVKGDIPDMSVWGTVGDFPVNLQSPFGNTGKEYDVIARSWTAETTSPGPATLRFFYHPSDLEALGEPNEIEDMIVYKVDGNNPYYAGATGYTAYTYSDTPPSTISKFIAGSWEGLAYVEFQVESFSSGSLAREVTELPVVLVSFEAVPSESAVVLNWKTATEENFSHFEVQRSLDSRNWRSIAKVKAGGTTTLNRFYSYVDYESVPASVVYYRLKMVDTDLTYSFSRIESVSRKEWRTLALRAYPNPVRDRLTVNTSEGIKGYRLLNSLGHTVLERKAGKTGVEEIDTRNLSSGVYILQLERSDGSQESQRIIKTK